MLRVWALAFVAASLLPVVASAQTPVPGCSRQCGPHDPDVNGANTPSAGPVNVVLYGHFEDILNSAPLNTQVPDPVMEPDLDRGFIMPILETNTGTPLDFHFKNNQFVMFSSPGPVEYTPEGWRTYQEPGLAYDVQLTKRIIPLYWYMSARSVPDQDLVSRPPIGAMPLVAVEARMETGRFPGQGLLIAAGDTAPSRVNMISLPTEPDVVYEFRVDMQVKHPIIPADARMNGFIVSVHPYQFRQGAVEAGQADWRMRSGARFPPRVILPVASALEARGINVTAFEGAVYVRAGFQSPFGAYDVDERGVRLEVRGPVPLPARALEEAVPRRGFEEGGSFRPASFTWRIPLEDFAPGQPYRFEASALSMQGTARAAQTADFQVPAFDQGTTVVPSPGFLWAVAAVLAVGGLARLRSTRAR